MVPQVITNSLSAARLVAASRSLKRSILQETAGTERPELRRKSASYASSEAVGGRLYTVVSSIRLTSDSAESCSLATVGCSFSHAASHAAAPAASHAAARAASP